MKNFPACICAILLVVLTSSCGGSDEPAPDVGTKSPDGSDPAGGGGGEFGPGTILPPPSVSTSAGAVPADWVTYRGAESRFSFLYPSSWRLLGGSSLFSWDPDLVAGPSFPTDGIKVEVYNGSVASSEARPAGATDLSLAGHQGWQILRSYDPASANGISVVHQIALEVSGNRFSLVGYFGSEVSDRTPFLILLSTLRENPR